MEKTNHLDEHLAKQFAQKMLECNLWWSFTIEAGQERIVASHALEKTLGRHVSSIEDLMGKYATSLPRLKIEEASQKKQVESSDFSRFVLSFETEQGKRSYQNQLQLVSEKPQLTFLVNCVDVTEMVEFEREIVDAQGRLSVSQVYEKQELLENQNRVIKDSYAKQSRFLGLLSHELRSPLLGITSLVKRLRSRLNANQEVEKMLKTISMTAQQSTYLVNDILTYTQAEYDGLKLHSSQHSLDEILENVKQLTRSLAHDKNLNLSVIQLTKHDDIYVDSVRLTQVLINLIINGIKFTELGGVNLEVKELADRQYRFIISDSGEGIPASSLQQIFKPFAQIESDDSENSGVRYLGAGLGLFVVKELISTMGGDITVSSQEKVGTQFEFTLSLSKSSQMASSQSERTPAIKSSNLSNQNDTDNIKTNNLKPTTSKKTPKENQELNKKKLQQEPLQNESNSAQEVVDLSTFNVLVADDSEINRMVLVGYLDDLHCLVDEASDGRAAWRKLQQKTYDYVMLDIQMPWMDGIEVAKKLKVLKDQGYQEKLKGVYAITAGGESGDFENVDVLMGLKIFDEWLVKPVSKKQIMALLKNKKNTRNSKNKVEKVDLGAKNASENESLQDGKSRLIELEQSEKITNLVAFDKAQIPEAFHHLIDPFISELQQNIIKLMEFNKGADSQAIKKLAHYIKGNAMLFQLDSLVNLCKQLENLNSVEGSDRDESSRKTSTNKVINEINSLLLSLEHAFST